MKRQKKKLNEIIIPSKDALFNSINSHKETNPSIAFRDKSLACFLYLTGARISEVVNIIKKSDIRTQEYKGKDMILIHNVPCLKRKTAVARRVIPIRLSDTIKPFWDIFNQYLNTLPGDDDIVYKMSRINAYKRIRRIEDEWYPHFFRHCRLTHMTQAGIRIPLLKQFTGWSSMKPADSYIHTAWKDVADAMLLED